MSTINNPKTPRTSLLTNQDGSESVDIVGGALKVTGSGGGGGVQYDDGTTQATPTGTVALGKNAANVLHAVSLDNSGNLNVNLAAGSITGGNAAAAPTGAAVPVSADYTGFNSGGNLVGVSASAPFPVTLANTGANATALKVDGSASTQPVSGTVAVSNFPATQPVSGTVAVSNFPATQPVSASALPLPSGAATSGKQPAFGTAGLASVDVITVQGVASMTALKTDGSGSTQPVSGTVAVSNFPATQPVSGTVAVSTLPALVAGTAVIGHVVVDTAPSTAVTNAGTFATQATLSAETTKVIGTVNVAAAQSIGVSGTVTGNQGTPAVAANAWPIKVTDGTNAVTVASLTNSKALAVEIVDGAGSQITSFGGGTQFADNAASGATPTGTLSMGWDSANSKVRALKVDASQNLDVNVQAGTVAVSTLPALVAGTAVIGHVIVDTAPSTAVTNAGTFATQSTLSAETTKVIGTVNISAGQTVTANAGSNLNTSALALDATLTGGTQKTKLVDSGGTNVGTIKAASTAAAATDPALVVAVSPNNAVAVTNTGTFATQSTLAAETTKVIGTVNVAAAQTIAVTNTGTFATQSTLASETTKVIGTVNVAAAQTIAVTQATPANLNATVTQQTLTKAVQGATGVSTQDLKDAGRSARTITLDSFAVAATAETIMTMSYSTDNGGLTTGTTYGVTTGKRLRIQTMNVALHTITGNTTAVTVIVRIRVNNAGAGLVSSPVQMIIPIQGIAAANQASIPIDLAIPDGWEFVAGAGIAVTVACAGFVATTAAPKVDISIVGYEY